MTVTFNQAVEGRRTYYVLGSEEIVETERIEEIVREAVKHAPSSFNSQSSRAVLLLGQQHKKLWEIAKTELKKIVPAENYPATEEKINGAFQSGYGTILYFEDSSVVAGLQEQFPAYRDNFPVWSNQASGMLQYIIWTALTAEGLGASLQHYNPLIDQAVKETWNIPVSWQLIAQMPFGKPLAQPGEKQFLPLEDRVKVYK